MLQERREEVERLESEQEEQEEVIQELEEQLQEMKEAASDDPPQMRIQIHVPKRMGPMIVPRRRRRVLTTSLEMTTVARKMGKSSSL